MNDGIYSDASNTLADAQAAFSGVSCLVEILGKCAPNEQITGIFIHSLLVDVKMHLDNVVDALPNMRQAVGCDISRRSSSQQNLSES